MKERLRGLGKFLCHYGSLPQQFHGFWTYLQIYHMRGQMFFLLHIHGWQNISLHVQNKSIFQVFIQYRL